MMIIGIGIDHWLMIGILMMNVNNDWKLMIIGIDHWLMINICYGQGIELIGNDGLM